MPWRPTQIRRQIDSLPTSTRVILVATDAGDGYLKAMGNPQGEHALARELVGTRLAAWLGLSVFDYAIIRVEDVPALTFAGGGTARPGPAFITRREQGEPWGGSAEQLRRLANPDDISRLVVFDTWTRNRDRRPPLGDSWQPNRDNVFLSTEAPRGKLTLRAMDHSHCFTAGGDLTRRIATIDSVKDPKIYGLFSEFRPRLKRNVVRAAADRLAAASRAAIVRVIGAIPAEWGVSQEAQAALADLIVGRAHFLAENIIDGLWPQRELRFGDDPEDRP